jgi:hypothetical protein
MAFEVGFMSCAGQKFKPVFFFFFFWGGGWENPKGYILSHE